MNRTKKSSVRFFSTLQSAKLSKNKINVVFYDRTLATRIPGFSGWLRKFDLAVPLDSGESLKALSEVDSVVSRLLRAPLSFSRSNTCFFAVGGGSIGDFVGFLASVFMRGVELVHIPTTWLSAMDSSHGGKTAVNSSGIKNFLGTFWPAQETWIFWVFFKNQSGARLQEAMGEAAKMALLDSRVWKALLQKSSPGAGWSPRRLWKGLPDLIAAKNRVVRQDPDETQGQRRVLNLGHTLGHALEAELKMAHGEAVGVGLFFALWVSWCEGILSTQDFFRLESKLVRDWGLSLESLPRIRIPRKKMGHFFLRDKKISAGGSLTFIGLRALGRPVQMEIPVSQLLDYWDGFRG